MATAIAPLQQDLVKESSGWHQVALTLPVVDQSSFDRAAQYVLDIKAVQQQADEAFDPIIRKAHEAHKEAVAQKRRITEPLVMAEGSLKSKMGEYLERERLLREAEERVARVEAERLAAERREAEIEEAEAAGASQEEIRSLSESPITVAPVIRSSPPKTAGITAREYWRAEVTDLLAVVRYVAQNPQFLNLLQANSVAVGAMARTLRSAMAVPGVKTWRDTGVMVRGRA